MAQGISRTAIAFAQNGLNTLVLVDLSLSRLETTRDDLRAKFPHVEVEILQVTFADEVSVKAAIRKATG